MQNIWQLKIMAQLCIRLLDCKTIHKPGKSDIGTKSGSICGQWALVHCTGQWALWSWCKTLHIPNKSDKMAQYVVNEHFDHGDKIGGSTLCSSRARCLVQLLKNIKIPVRRRFHLYSFLPYLIILLNRVLFNKTSPNHSSVTFLSSAIGTSKREVLRLPVYR